MYVWHVLFFSNSTLTLTSFYIEPLIPTLRASIRNHWTITMRNISTLISTYIYKKRVSWAAGHLDTATYFVFSTNKLGSQLSKLHSEWEKKSKQRMLLLFFCHWLSTLDWCKCILIIFCPPGPLGGSWGALLYESTNLSMSILIKIQIKLTFIFKWSCLFVLVYQSRTD